MPPKDTRDIAMQASSRADLAIDRIDQHTKDCATYRAENTRKWEKAFDMLDKLDDNNKRITMIAGGAVIFFTALTRLPDFLTWFKTMLGH